MTFTPAEHAAVSAHAAALGLTADAYVHRCAAEQALAWKRQHEALQEIATRRGTTIEAVVGRGILRDDAL